MSILKYGSTTISPTPVVQIERERLGDPDGAFQGYRETWRISGEVIAATPAAVQSAYEALQTAFANAGQDLVLYADDGVTIKHSLIHSQCLHGVKIAKPFSYPKGEGAELATLRSYTVELSGVKVLNGTQSNTAWGEVTTQITTDAQGQQRIVVSGSYRGAGAAAAAAAAKLSGKIVESEETRTNADRAEVAFTYQYINASASRAIVSWRESVSVDASLPDFVFRKPLGQTPIKQTTVYSTARATQSGEAVGRSAYPTAGNPLYSVNDLRRYTIAHDAPRLSKDGQYTEFVTRWNYDYEFATTPATVTPAAPPA